MARLRSAGIAVGGIALVVGSVALVSPILVRRKAASWGERQHMHVDIGSVRPGLRGVILRDVKVGLENVPELTVSLDQVGVAWGGRVDVYGGSVHVSGTRESVLDHVRAWRAMAKRTGDGGSSAKRSVSVAAIAVDWSGIGGDVQSIAIRGLSSVDVLSSSRLRLDQADLALASGHVKAEAVEVNWVSGESFRLGSFACAKLSATVRVSESRDGDGIAAKVEPSSDEKIWQKIEKNREKLTDLAMTAVGGLVPGASIRVAALDAEIQKGKDKLTLGPGSLSIEEREGRLRVELAPQGAKPGNGVTFKATIPTGAGAIVLDVLGGPVPLSTLGLKEGDLGLKDVEKASFEAKVHVEVQDEPKVLSFDLTGKLNGLGIEYAKLAPEPVEGLALALRMKGALGLDGSFFRLDDGELDVGAVQIELRGNVERRGEGVDVDAKFGIPLVSCQSVLEALPKSLIPTIHGMTAAGTLSLRGKTHWEAKRPDAFVLDYAASNDCRATHVPASVDVARFRAPFRRKVYAPDGSRIEIDSGPGTPVWVSTGGISQFMDAAVMTTEDGRFRLHQGFDHEAIRNSVRENLKAGKFLRGASTISMQLAKNLYLDRSKNLSRKLQELILTMYLEQALTKEQILELYLNVIEFGPMIYGIGPASAHYFKTTPSELSLSQAMYLASVLPNPKRQFFGAGGRVTPGHTKYLHRLIRIAGKMRWLSSDEVELGIRETPVLGMALPERTEPDLGDEDSRAPDDDGP